MLFPIRFSHDKAVAPSSGFSSAYAFNEFRLAAQTLGDVVRFGALDIASWDALAQEVPVFEQVVSVREETKTYSSTPLLREWQAADRLTYEVGAFCTRNNGFSRKPPLASVSIDFRVPDRLLFYAIVDQPRLESLLTNCLDVDALNDPARESFYKVSSSQSVFDLPTYH